MVKVFERLTCRVVVLNAMLYCTVLRCALSCAVLWSERMNERQVELFVHTFFILIEKEVCVPG